ncbi:MAG TPA: cytochrome c oxidase subunit 3 [Steroidobacteraceae bacterium]|nr:cytochrome c oxidase subunit 3 [Steroidobacteraceae bacterium]
MQPAAASGKYYIPHGSKWPIVGSVALFTFMLGAVAKLNDWSSAWSFLPGALILAYMFFGWFSVVIGESEAGIYNMDVDRSFRMGMIWFIFSEVMFFASFFGALFYARELSVPWLSGEGVKIFNKLLLWKNFGSAWPSNGPLHLSPRADGTFETIPAFGKPALNTAILLTSGFTITMAHHALKASRRVPLLVWLGLTIILGFSFVGFQASEYMEAYTEKGLQLGTGVYGSTFFMLTGFHGLHVTLGAIMLTVIWFRCLKGHFTPQRHFGFEAVAWYWHFVDVVWLGLFIFVYWI